MEKCIILKKVLYTLNIFGNCDCNIKKTNYDKFLKNCLHFIKKFL